MLSCVPSRKTDGLHAARCCLSSFAVFGSGRGPRVGHRLRLRMQRPALQAGFLPVLGPMASSPTHCANCVRSVQTVATKSEHEACFARWPWALCSSALHRRRSRWPTHGLVDVDATDSQTPVQRRGSAAVGGVVQSLSMPAEDGGEANPGSKGGAGGRRLTAGDMDGFASPPSSARATQHDGQQCAGCGRRTEHPRCWSIRDCVRGYKAASLRTGFCAASARKSSSQPLSLPRAACRCAGVVLLCSWAMKAQLYSVNRCW